MTTYIALLRGINVSGKRLIKMDALKTLCTSLGFEHVQTYIQSGNIVFQTTQKKTAVLQDTLRIALETAFGFEVPVCIKTSTELTQIITQNPFTSNPSFNPEHLHITFLHSPTDHTLLSKIDREKFLPDEFTLIGEAIYLHCPKGYGHTKLTNTFFENKLKQPCTTRNLKTCLTLQQMAASR
ncbi:MAG: DUF1697 domain-containing protein [Bacteroidetes bacterium]|nr:DUF1697 domain-containing protein [Bacteroidota bacterium]